MPFHHLPNEHTRHPAPFITKTESSKKMLDKIQIITYVHFFLICYIFILEAWTGFEPVNSGFADHCLATWLPRHKSTKT